MYIRTEDNKVIETIKDPYVTPIIDKESWALMVEESGSSKKVIIANFDSVSDANMALDNLRNAQTRKHGWDAIAYKNELARLRKNQ